MASTNNTNEATQTIQIKYHVGGITPVEQVNGSDWIDLRTAEDVDLQPTNQYFINLGISMKLPEGYEAHLVARSSTFGKYGIIQTNCMGVIDESYCGDDDVWKLPVYATRFGFIPKDTRIAQFRIVKKQPTITFETVDSLDDVSRGGFGSTGEN